MYDRRGDRNGYLGYKYRHWLRFGVSSAGRLRAGFAASQDAGEPFFSGSNSMGYDFYSFFIEARRLGPVGLFRHHRPQLRHDQQLCLCSRGA